MAADLPLRIVPVLDLQGGVVVHARRGDRDAYAPLHSPLVDRPDDPVAVARTLCEQCATRTVYVADLDAIAGAAVDEATLTALADHADLWVDAGAVTADARDALARAGVARNVVGTESLRPSEPAAAEPTQAPAADELPRILSVDLRDGRIISPRPDLHGREPAAAASLATELGVTELLVIDLGRVGSSAGPPLRAVHELAGALPGVDVYAGGGVRDDADLRALADAGAAGALVATALHEARITVPGHSGHSGHSGRLDR